MSKDYDYSANVFVKAPEGVPIYNKAISHDTPVAVAKDIDTAQLIVDALNRPATTGWA